MDEITKIKMYIKRNYRLSLWQFIVFLVLTFLSMMLFLSSIDSAFMANKNYENLDYSVVGYTINVQSEENVFIQNSSLRFSASDEDMQELNYLDTFLVMENKDTTYNASPNLIDENLVMTEHTPLLDDEVSISKQVSENYGIYQGDVVVIKHQSLLYYFTVRDIFSYTFGFLSYEQKSSGMVVLGYNSMLENTSNQVYVNYVVDESIMFTEATLKSTLIEQAETECVQNILLFSFCLIIFILLIEFITQFVYITKGFVQYGALKDYKYLCKSGVSYVAIFLTIFTEKLLKLFVPIGLSFMAYVLLCLQHTQMLLMLIAILAILLFIGVLIISSFYMVKMKGD